MTPCLLGVDVGTSVIKCTLFDGNGKERAVAAREATLLRPQPGWVELEMEAVWQAVCATLGEAVQAARDQGLGGRIAAIGVTAQGDGTWLVDANGQPLRNAITWLDARTGDTVAAAHAAGLSDRLFAITGTALNTANQALHLRWLQEHEPRLLERAAAALRAKDWVFLRLTGLLGSDATDASHTYFANAAADPAERGFAPAVLELLGIGAQRHLLPPTPEPHANQAPLRAEVAHAVGLPAGLPVTAGPFDVCAASIGAGALRHGDACTVLGTAGIHAIVIDAPAPEPQGIGYTIAYGPPGLLLRLLPTMTGTLNLEWFTREFFAHERAQAGADFWTQAETLAGRVPLGCDGVLYHPYIDAAGERSPFVRPDARAQFTGLSAHHTRAVLLRAVYEGVLLSALDCYGQIGPLRALTLTGGGARSPFWAQMFADGLGCPVQTVQGSESGARGAAIAAGIAVGLFASYAEGVAALVHPGRTYEPDRDNTQRYAELLALYRRTHVAMRPLWEERAAWRKRHPWKAGTL